MSNRAYVPPCFRNNGQRNYNNNNRLPQPPRHHHEEEDLHEEIEYLRHNQSRAEQVARNLEAENNKLKQQIAALEKDLDFYTSNGAKVPASDFTKLQADFNAYKQQKYNEFASIKDKLKSHDETVSNLNKENRKLEESLRLEKAKVIQYANSVKDLNIRIKHLQEAQPVMISAPQPQSETTNQQLIEADWNNIRQALDFILSLDKKELSRAGFNAAALKLTRQLIK